MGNETFYGDGLTEIGSETGCWNVLQRQTILVYCKSDPTPVFLGPET